MFDVRSLLVALLVAAVLGTLGTLYYWTIRRRQEEALNGVRALSAMRWREFSHFVLDAMRHRGYDVLSGDDDADRGQQTEFLLSRNGERALLGAKHGSAYRLTKQSVGEFVAAMKFQGARSGLLVTPGSIDPDARKHAEDARVELIDGNALWPEIAPLLPQSLSDDVRKDAAKKARRHVWLSWVGALIVGIAVGLFATDSAPPPPPTDLRVSHPAPSAPAAARADAPAASPTITGATAAKERVASPPATLVIPITPEEEELQRAEVVRRVASLPGVYRAVWSTRITLQVQVDETSTQRFDEICTVLMRYDTLRTARVHLQPPEHSEQMPRFKQCATY
jgi:restriction system protein